MRGVCFSQSDAQVGYLNTDLNNSIDAFYIKYPNERFHSSMKPYVQFSIREANDTAFHVYNYKIKNYFLFNDIRSKPQYRNRFAAQFLPQVDMQAGFDVLKNKFVSETSGGMYSRLDINDDFSADFTFIGGQVSYPNFTDTVVSQYKIIPGLGRAYGNNGKYNFTNFTGHLSYSPIRILNFQLGKDKMFIGDGYRSLLLSDVTNNYPYFKTTINVWKLQYSVWYSALKDIYQTDGIQNNFRNKYTTAHYLSFNATPEFNISFFETEVWQGNDTNRHRGFDPNYLNPVIFYRPIEYSLGSGDNALMGLNASYKFLQRYKIYGQVVIDEFNLVEIRKFTRWWANKQGFQIGAKCIDLFGIKNLSFQAEYNYVRPFTYSHGSPQQNYAHYNQPLAHPFGANFSEGLGIITYKHKRWQLDFKGIIATIGKDTAGSAFSVGQNIFLSYTLRGKDYGNNILQGNKTHFAQGEIKFTYFIIPGLNLRLEAGYIQRYEKSDLGYLNQSPYVYLGIKTSMYNFYRDY
ncbi:MAG TPA: hypothetical protein VNZ49_07685 [Bacteroidia bacterium]|jgi:hypothetical protein|nr:hypothetical protein [Bacteroidia bacterium]